MSLLGWVRCNGCKGLFIAECTQVPAYNADRRLQAVLHDNLCGNCRAKLPKIEDVLHGRIFGAPETMHNPKISPETLEFTTHAFESGRRDGNGRIYNSCIQMQFAEWFEHNVLDFIFEHANE